MPSTYTNNLGIELPVDGELDGVWGDVVNDNMGILDRAINGSLNLSLSGTSSNLTTGEGSDTGVDTYGQYKLLVLGGTPSGTHTITILPNDAQKIYFVTNGTAQSVVFTQGSGGNVTIAAGDSGIIYSNGAGAGAAVANITNDFAMSSVKITGGSISGITDLAVADGGTGASDAGTARTNLGLAIGTNVQAYDAELTAIAALAVTDGNFIVGNGTTWVAESGSTARTSLGLGTIATQNSASVSITGGSIAGITDLAVADGGTGASDAGTARTNLGLAIGTNVQAYDAGLQSIAGLTTTADRMIYTTASDVYAVATLTAAGRAILDDADATAQRTTLGLAIGTNVQAWDANLDQVAALAVTDGNFIVGDGTAWVAESGATARTSLGLGTIATQAANSVSITGGSITGITDLAVADGGTGLSTVPTNGQLLIGNGTGYSLAALTAGAGVTITNGSGSITVGIPARAVAAPSTSGTLTPNGDTTDVFNAFSLSGGITLAAPSGTPVDGQKLILRLRDNGTVRAITWTTTSGAYREIGITLPVTTTANKIIYVGCVYNSTDSFWDAVALTTQA